MGKVSDWIRSLLLIALVVVLAVMGGIRLMKLQIVQGASYLEMSERTYSGTQLVQAARGEIYDTNGKSLIVNEVGYNVVVEKAFLRTGTENEIMLRVAKLLSEHGEEWIDSLPITKGEPYAFLPESASDISKLKQNLNLNVYATVDNCMNSLVEKYDLESYTSEEQRIIAGIRYEMLLMDFSISNRYTLAEDVSIEAVSALREHTFDLRGIDIVEDAIRVYSQGDIAPHLLGVVGNIDAVEYAKNKGKGYRLNDVIGKFGIELGMEEYLRGTDGTRTITQSTNGEVISTKVTDPAIPGNSIKLTIDSDLQRQLQKDMETHIEMLRAQEEGKDGQLVKGGSIVVLDVRTGGVLASVNYPSYDLNDYLDNYYDVLTAEGNPTFNRAFNGLYRPGSTYKTVTAIAALQQGTIDSHSTVHCTGSYTYFPTQKFGCTAWHGTTDVVNSIRKSCNIFFYDAGRRTGIDAIQKLSYKFGLGIDLGMEIPNKEGYVSGPDTSEALDKDWYPADVVQAAIGQLDTTVSPLQMAVQAMTIANHGTLVQPHIVESIYDYNMETLVERKNRVELSTMKDSDAFYDLVIEGMVLCSKDNYGGLGPDGQNLYTHLGFDVAIKTGTPQVATDLFNSAIIGFAPADNPQIAFAILLEEGERARYLAGNICDAYFGAKD